MGCTHCTRGYSKIQYLFGTILGANHDVRRISVAATEIKIVPLSSLQIWSGHDVPRTSDGKSMGQNGAVDKHSNFHAKFTSIWYNKKNGRGVKI